MSNHHNSNQPPPSPGGQIVLPHVIADILTRAEHGRNKYGDYLRTENSANGRSGLIDLYQELLDAVMYIKQLLMEMEKEQPPQRQHVDPQHRYWEIISLGGVWCVSCGLPLVPPAPDGDFHPGVELKLISGKIVTICDRCIAGMSIDLQNHIDEERQSHA